MPIDELEHWQQAYQDQPNVYEDFSRCAREGIVIQRLLEHARFRKKTVLEIGCGSGTQTKQLAPLSRRYLALDVSAPIVRPREEEVRPADESHFCPRRR